MISGTAFGGCVLGSSSAPPLFCIQPSTYTEVETPGPDFDAGHGRSRIRRLTIVVPPPLQIVIFRIMLRFSLATESTCAWRTHLCRTGLPRNSSMQRALAACPFITRIPPSGTASFVAPAGSIRLTSNSTYRPRLQLHERLIRRPVEIKIIGGLAANYCGLQRDMRFGRESQIFSI